MRIQSLISKIANGTIFGSSRIGRILGIVISLGILLGFLYVMSL